MNLQPSVSVLFLCLLLFFPALNHARYLPLLDPLPGPKLPLQMEHIARPSLAAAPSPTVLLNIPCDLLSVVMPMAVGNHARHVNLELTLAIVLATVGVTSIILALFATWFYWRRVQLKAAPDGVEGSDVAKGLIPGPLLSELNSVKTMVKKGSVSAIDHTLLEAATNNFDASCILGEGGFGCVYKARLHDGASVAVKKMDNCGHDSEREFQNEMQLLSRIQHPNIISLLGYSINDQTQFLVFELMQNGSLETQLHGPSHGSSLAWRTRMKIALDVARGLEHLHEHQNPPVIHRDLKSSNILLDAEFNAKISDFGLAVTDQNKSSSRLSGTLGYVAPEYLLDGNLTEKSDVYAFGVILLELLIGKKPVEKMSPSQCQSLVSLVMPQLTDRSKLPNIVDPVIRNTMDLKHLYQIAAIAVLCIQPEPSYRPLITDVLHSLIPLVPIELGGALKVAETLASTCTSAGL